MFPCDLLNKQLHKFTLPFVSHMCEFIINFATLVNKCQCSKLQGQGPPS